MEIKSIKYADIPEEFIKKACKERISFLDGEGVYFWGAYNDSLLVGCTALVIYKNGQGRIKSNYVLQEFRGQGIFKKLNTLCLEFDRSQGVKNIVLNCLPISADIHMKCGAVLWKETKTIKYLVYRLEGDKCE